MGTGRGRSPSRIIEDLNSKLRGWVTYYRHVEIKRVL
ncbi:MAG: group II intron maturase-specific domain-containing protein [Chromatocurvus sp.]